MHVYIYDTFVSDRKYEKIVARIETRITDLGLNGKIVRLGITTNVFSTIENEVRKGAKTIVVVGNNAIYNQAINALARLSGLGLMSRAVPLGFIPIDAKASKIAKYFGIENYEEACDFISARRIEPIGLGLANDQYFLTQARITTVGSMLEIDKDYTIEILENGDIYVINLPTEIDLPEKIESKATDNYLELYIKTASGKNYNPLGKKNFHKSVFPFQNLIIVNKNHPVILDESIEVKTPVNIRLSKDKINLIVGKAKNL